MLNIMHTSIPLFFCRAQIWTFFWPLRVIDKSSRSFSCILMCVISCIAESISIWLISLNEWQQVTKIILFLFVTPFCLLAWQFQSYFQAESRHTFTEQPLESCLKPLLLRVYIVPGSLTTSRNIHIKFCFNVRRII